MSRTPKGVAPSIEEVVGQYEERRPMCQQFTTKLHSLLEELLVSRSVRYSIVESRCKTLDSLREKITREGKTYADPLLEITDQCGIRVILYYTDDLDAVDKLIADEFDLDASASGDKCHILKPHEFGYTSVHYVVSLNSDRSALSEWQTYTGLRAEIQVRTVLQHAWASISHAIDYKHELDVPSQLRRKLFRLSALLELADEQFAELRSEKQTLVSRTERQIGKGELEIELNMDTVREFMSSSIIINATLKALRHAGFQVSTSDSYLSEFISHCRGLGISTIKELQDLLESVQQVQDLYLHNLMSITIKKGLLSWIAPPSFFVLIVLLCAKRDSVDRAALMDLGWSNKVVSSILTAFKSIKDTDPASRRPKGRG